jgi:ABC-2 type transport system ATP-binding protein
MAPRPAAQNRSASFPAAVDPWPAAEGEPLAAALVATELRKVFRHPWLLRTRTAVDGVSLTVERGEIFGLLGPNGAGKTTTIKMLLGLLRPTAGRAWLLGRPAGTPESRQRVGYLPENPYFFDRLTAREFLVLSGRLAGLDGHAAGRCADYWLERLGLETRARTALRKFSKGMLQRVGLAQALLAKPDLVFLDEPMSGLDPLGRREFRDLILDCRDRGVTVVFSSHILPDVERLCDRVAVLSNGRLARLGPLDELLEGEGRGAEIELVGPRPLLLPKLLSSVPQSAHGERLVLSARTQEEVDGLLAHVSGKGYRVMAVTPRRRSLESVVLECAHEQRREQGAAARAGTPQRRSA